MIEEQEQEEKNNKEKISFCKEYTELLEEDVIKLFYNNKDKILKIDDK